MKKHPAIRLTALDPTGKPIPVFLPGDESTPDSLRDLREPNQLVTLCTYLAKTVPVYLELDALRSHGLSYYDLGDIECEMNQLAKTIKNWGYRVQEIF